MRAMSWVTVSAIIATGLSGCPRPYPPAGAARADDPSDGRWCGSSASDVRVYVDIEYAADGTPSAHPDNCTVSPNTRITWRAPLDRPGFRIEFPGAPPAIDARTREWTSSLVRDRHRVSIDAGTTPGTYKYDIEANGIVVDPAIIIRR